VLILAYDIEKSSGGAPLSTVVKAIICVRKQHLNQIELLIEGADWFV